MNRHVFRGRLLTLTGLVAAAAAVGGCFNQKSYPMDPAELRLFTRGELLEGSEPATARRWAERIHHHLNDCLPSDARQGITTENLCEGANAVLAAGSAAKPVKAVDVCRKYGLNPDRLSKLLSNMSGLLCTAQMVDDSEIPEVGAPGDAATDWIGFQAVDVPVDARVSLCGQLASQPGFRRRAGKGDFVIIVHGLFGNLGEFRYRDLAQALNHQGFGVLALDMRGHGRTGRKSPENPMTFGLLEPGDLRMAAWWLRRHHGAGRIGLVGFSMGGYQSLLAAWQDSGHPNEPDPLARLIGTRPGEEKPGSAGAPARPCFDGGVVAISPIIDSVGLAGQMSTEVSFFRDPVRWSLQNRVRRRLAHIGSPVASAWMWDLFEFEIGRSQLAGRYPDRKAFERAGLAGVSLRGPDWSDGIAKMESIRTPLLVLHAANDPLTPAQMVVELAARVANPNLAVIILPDGGHTGFPALSTAYYYSLLLNFFDPAAGPKPAPRLEPLPAQARAGALR